MAPKHACLCAPYSADPSIYMWSIQWWPHALAAGVNPLVTHVIWAPTGVGLAWATTVPSAALLGLPLLELAGPVAAYNALMLVAPVLAAYGAYRLCRELTGAFWPSVAGGYVFGFSTYMLGHLLGHLNLVSIWPIPFIALVVLLHARGRIGRLRFLLFAVPLALVEFGFSTELFATTCAFGAFALLVAYVSADHQLRVRLRRVLASLAACLAIVLVLLSPYLFYVVTDRPSGALGSRTKISVDVVNTVVPSSLTQLRIPALADRVTRNESETVGYFGLPLLAIVVAFAVFERKSLRGRVVAGTFALATLASFGPWLWFAGTRSRILNPLGAYGFLPIVGNALPARFVVYAFLAAGAAVAYWLVQKPGAGRWTLAGVALAALVPNVTHHWFNRHVPQPPFFRQFQPASLTAGDGNVVVLPYGARGFSMLWQAQAQMAFRMAGGYIGPRTPRQFRDYPIVYDLEQDTVPPFGELLLRRFLRDKDVRAIVIAPGANPRWATVLRKIAGHPRRSGGVQIYDVPARRV